MKIAYIAFDGNQFDTESECKKYESKFNVFFFDSKGNEIPFEPSYRPIFIYISNYASLDYFKIKIDEWKKEKSNEKEFYIDDFYFPGLFIADENHFYRYERTKAGIAERILKEKEF